MHDVVRLQEIPMVQMDFARFQAPEHTPDLELLEMQRRDEMCEILPLNAVRVRAGLQCGLHGGIAHARSQVDVDGGWTEIRLLEDAREEGWLQFAVDGVGGARISAGG